MIFTHAEYAAYMHFKCVQFEYSYALHNLDDDSTKSDMEEVEHLRSKYNECLNTPSVQRVLRQFSVNNT